MTTELPDLSEEAHDLLSALAGIDTHDVDLRDHAKAYEAVEAFTSAAIAADRAQRASDNVVPGRMRCAKCQFELTRVNLYVKTGTAGAGGNETEPCPNGCGPLWPVTWEQEARACWKANEAMFERMKAAEDALAALRAPGLRVVEADRAQRVGLTREGLMRAYAEHTRFAGTRLESTDLDGMLSQINAEISATPPAPTQAPPATAQTQEQQR